MAGNVRILILEDDILTLSYILNRLSKVESLDISLVILSEYVFVEKFINNSDEEFDLILLDRDCFLGGSFHVLNIENIGANKIISISSVPEYNQQAMKRGVSRVVWKDYENLDKFADQLMSEIREYFKI